MKVIAPTRQEWARNQGGAEGEGALRPLPFAQSQPPLFIFFPIFFYSQEKQKFLTEKNG